MVIALLKSHRLVKRQLVLGLDPCNRFRRIDVFQPTVGVLDLCAMVIVYLVAGGRFRVSECGLRHLMIIPCVSS
jgi:hypothetical protein